jgi:hypothetical protein
MTTPPRDPRFHVGRLCVVLFAVSTAFPAIASVRAVAPPPRWLGVADVAVAALLVGVAITVATRSRRAVTDRHRLAALRAMQRLVGVVPALLVLFFVVGVNIDWTVLTIGLAWRGWLFACTLPSLVVATERPTSVDR